MPQKRGLRPKPVPGRGCPSLKLRLSSPDQDVARLRTFRKPKYMVKYDINPTAPYPAGPLCHIYTIAWLQRVLGLWSGKRNSLRPSLRKPFQKAWMTLGTFFLYCLIQPGLWEFCVRLAYWAGWNKAEPNGRHEGRGLWALSRAPLAAHPRTW